MATLPNDLADDWQRIVLTIPDPDADPAESDDYAAMLDMETPDGTRVARYSADALHNHAGFYTRKHPLSDPSGKMLKRLNIQGGKEETEVRMLSPTSSRFLLSAADSAILDFYSESMPSRPLLYADPTKNALRLADLNGGELMRWSLGANPAIDLRGTPLTGLNPTHPVPAVEEIADPAPEDVPERGLVFDGENERLCYRPSGSSDVFWFRACGTL